MSLTLITAPTLEPLTVEEVMAHLRAEETDEVPVIMALLRAARQHLENASGRAFLTQTWELTLDCFPGTYLGLWPESWSQAEIRLPRAPLQSVTYVKYLDDTGTLQTLATTEYQVVSKSEPARVVPAYGKVWPTTRAQPEAVTVRYLAGWTAAAAVPEPIKQAIKLLVGHLYEHREAVTDNPTAVVVPLAVETLLWPYRLPEAA